MILVRPFCMAPFAYRSLLAATGFYRMNPLS
jgi:hypothetical protein